MKSIEKIKQQILSRQIMGEIASFIIPNYSEGLYSMIGKTIKLKSGDTSAAFNKLGLRSFNMQEAKQYILKHYPNKVNLNTFSICFDNGYSKDSNVGVRIKFFNDELKNYEDQYYFLGHKENDKIAKVIDQNSFVFIERYDALSIKEHMRRVEDLKEDLKRAENLIPTWLRS